LLPLPNALFGLRDDGQTEKQQLKLCSNFNLGKTQ